MGVEVERKFLVISDAWRAGARSCRIRQGYLCLGSDATVRVRVADNAAFLTVKSRTEGMSRAEFEYSIPLSDAEAMLADLCAMPLIEKTRYFVLHGGREWTVDVFGAGNAGLVLAEVELEHPSVVLDLPAWVGAEVTQDPRYRNSALVTALQEQAEDE